MKARQMARAADFLADLNSAASKHRIHIEDVGGYEKQLALVDSDTGETLFGSCGYLKWDKEASTFVVETY